MNCWNILLLAALSVAQQCTAISIPQRDDIMSELEKLGTDRSDDSTSESREEKIQEVRELMSNWIAGNVIQVLIRSEGYAAKKEEERNGWYDRSSTRACDSKKLSKCVEKLADTFAFAGALMKPVTQAALTSACGQIAPVSKCVQGVGCTDTESLSVQWGWTGIKDSLSYLCSDGKQGLAKVQTCLTTKVDTYYDQLLGCLALIKDPRAAPCSYFNSQLACYAQAARDNCGALDFAVAYYIKSYQPMTAFETGCKYSYKNKKEELGEQIRDLIDQLEG